ncbi:sensor histidine kinase [Deinococcus pimensis]|uniref:sensor histidine kinase n=1 Tax=Deinococcus pimensis TaxID=309888 RepID=UPI0004AE135E|nr:ATP-binding protein [Deinococcus pimensis]
MPPDREDIRTREDLTTLRRLVDANPIGVVLGHADGRLPYVNDAYLRLLRISREDYEAGRLNWQTVTPPEWLPADERAIEETLRRGFCAPYEKEYLLPDGTRVPVLVSVARASPDDESLVAYVVDLTDRKALERALDDQNARLRALNRQILQSAAEGIFGLDAEGLTTFANPAALAMTGFTAEEMLGRPQHALIHHTRADGTPYPEEVCPVRLAREDGVTRVVDDEVFWRRDGTSFPVEYTATPLRGLRGEIEGVVVTFRDVTRRRLTEQELRRTADDLRRSNRDLEQFAFVAAHDLQEPLRTITSFAQLLERRYGDVLEGDARRYLNFVTGGATRMKALVDALLTYANLGATTPPVTDVDLDVVAGGVLEDLRDAVERSGAVVTVGPLGVVRGDEDRLAMVLRNLVANALKFRREGVPPRVHVSAERVGSAVHLRVRDNGVGIGEAYLTKVFGMFQRLHRKDEYEGTGLGLAIVRKVVESLGGDVRVESVPGKGSTFHVRLPLAP